MKNSIQLSDFRFSFIGYGHCKVTYTSPTTGKVWAKTIDYMPIIDATKESDAPKVKDLITLKKMIKQS